VRDAAGRLASQGAGPWGRIRCAPVCDGHGRGAFWGGVGPAWRARGRTVEAREGASRPGSRCSAASARGPLGRPRRSSNVPTRSSCSARGLQCPWTAPVGSRAPSTSPCVDEPGDQLLRVEPPVESQHEPRPAPPPRPEASCLGARARCLRPTGLGGGRGPTRSPTSASRGRPSPTRPP